MTTKSVLKSKTIWVNLVTIVFVLAAHYGIVPNQEVAEEIAKMLIYASPVLNGALRMITKDAVKLY